LDNIYEDGLEDLEVLAFSGLSVQNGAKPSNRPGQPRTTFAALLNELGDEHERVVQKSAKHETECAALRIRLKNLGSRSKPSLSEPTSPAPLRRSASDPSDQTGTTSPKEDLRATGRADIPLPSEVLEDADTEQIADDVKEVVDEDTMGSQPPASPQTKRARLQFQVADEERSLSIAPVSSSPKNALSRKEPQNGEETHTFSLHNRWAKDKTLGFMRANQSAKGVEQSSSSRHGNTYQGQKGSVETMEHSYNGGLRRLIRYPTSPRQVTWDCVGAVLIFYDLLAIPLKVFEPPETTFTIFIDMFALIFWTLNMGASLTVGYLEDGKYVMSPAKILKSYLKFWFWIDCAVVAPDWTFTIIKMAMQDENSAGSSVKLLRILRLIRCMRLLRLAKLKWIVASIKDLINSEAIDIGFSIVKMILMLLIVNHFLACLWFATTYADMGETWVQKYWGDQDVTWGYQYVTSFHWAITQFTPSSMDVQPQNVVERTFTIVVVVFGLVGFSYLVGSITGSLAELRRMGDEAAKQFWKLRIFLKKSHVPMPLRIRIEKYCEHAWQLQKDASGGGELPILRLLTEQLRNELNCAISMPHLEVHPLFEYLCSTSEVAMQRIATKALNRKLLARNETHFHAGEIAPKLGFVVAGRLQYIKHLTETEVGRNMSLESLDRIPSKDSAASDTSLPDHVEWVDKGEDWITEPALWMGEWMTLGELVAASVSELLEVSATEFAEAIKRTPQVFERICVYAQNFVLWLNNQTRKDLSDICQGDIIGAEIEMMLVDGEANEDLHDILHNPKHHPPVAPKSGAAGFLQRTGRSKTMGLTAASLTGSMSSIGKHGSLRHST
jgi:hypothetical protein